MITIKPFHKPTGPGRFDLLASVTVDIPGKKVTSTYRPPAAMSLTTPDQATQVFFSDPYQGGLARLVRQMAPGWRVGAPSPANPPAKPAAPVHAVKKPMRPAAANDLIDSLYGGAPRVQSSPMPREESGSVVTTKDGKMAVKVDPKAETVEQLTDLRLVDGKMVDINTRDGLMTMWVTRPAPNRRVRDLATLLAVKGQKILDTLLESGDTSIQSIMSILTDQQAAKVAAELMKR